MLSPTRVQALLNGHTAMARKVYEVVPIREAWPLAQIMAALTTCHADARAVLGRLEDLRETGLVNEFNGLFQRAPVRQAKPAKEKPQSTTNPGDNILTLPTTKPAAANAAPSPLDLLAELSAEVVALGSEFQTRVRKLAARIEEAALLVEQERETHAEKMADLAQLQTLLKKLA
ncbi:MAG TPA: hypothetical protein VIZ86_16460 [Pseudomonas sp.]